MIAAAAAGGVLFIAAVSLLVAGVVAVRRRIKNQAMLNRQPMGLDLQTHRYVDAMLAQKLTAAHIDRSL